MIVSQLGLRGNALKAALEFEARYPGSVFTSGRRNLADQCRAMAQNVVSNRKWIEQTYKPTPVSKAAQTWIDATPVARSVDEIAKGLFAVLSTFSDDELGKMSCHFSGDAFDVEPDGHADRDDFLRALAVKYGGKFLDKEGGLKRRHWQARP